MMRRSVILLALLPILAIFNYAIFQKETLRRGGELILLELAPVDPRSLMQGDYMRLRYKLADEAGKLLRDPQIGDLDEKALLASGRLVVRLDADHHASFVRFYVADETLAKDERLLPFKLDRNRSTRPISIEPDAFFFEEGSADRFQTARFGKIHMDSNRDYVLVGLADEAGKMISAGK